METSPVATGVPLCTDAQAAQIDAKIAEEVPSYSPGKFIESAKFFNDVKVSNRHLFEKYESRMLADFFVFYVIARLA